MIVAFNEKKVINAKEFSFTFAYSFRGVSIVRHRILRVQLGNFKYVVKTHYPNYEGSKLEDLRNYRRFT